MKPPLVQLEPNLPNIAHVRKERERHVKHKEILLMQQVHIRNSAPKCILKTFDLGGEKKREIKPVLD